MGPEALPPVPPLRPWSFMMMMMMTEILQYLMEASTDLCRYGDKLGS